MDERKLMQMISAKLQAKPAHVIARTLITKENGSDKMFARLDGSRKHSAPENPHWGEVTIETDYCGLIVGGDYESFVEGAAVRSGAATKKSDVEVETRPSWHIFENRFFETDKATHSKFYLKIQTSESTLTKAPTLVRMTETYIIGGKRYTRKQAEEILAGYLKPIKVKKATSTQVDAGVDDKNKVHYYMPKLADIVYIKQDNFTYQK
jgi:hypothetical protein